MTSAKAVGILRIIRMEFEFGFVVAAECEETTKPLRTVLNRGDGRRDAADRNETPKTVAR